MGKVSTKRGETERDNGDGDGREVRETIEKITFGTQFYVIRTTGTRMTTSLQGKAATVDGEG